MKDFRHALILWGALFLFLGGCSSIMASKSYTGNWSADGRVYSVDIKNVQSMYVLWTDLAKRNNRPYQVLAFHKPLTFTEAVEVCQMLGLAMLTNNPLEWTFSCGPG